MPLFVCIIIAIVVCYGINAIVSRKSAKRQGQQHYADSQRHLSEYYQQRIDAEQAMEQYAAKNDLRIMTESLDIIQSTKDINIALRRVLTIKDCACRLVDHQQRNIIHVSDEMLKYANMTSKDEANFIREVIEHVYQKVQASALMLKTEKGRKNRLEMFFKKLHENVDLIPDSLYPWLNSKMADAGIEFDFESIKDNTPNPNE